MPRALAVASTFPSRLRASAASPLECAAMNFVRRTSYSSTRTWCSHEAQVCDCRYDLEQYSEFRSTRMQYYMGSVQLSGYGMGGLHYL